MSLTIGAATDYTVTLAQEAVVGITVGGQQVQVSDGPLVAESLAVFAVGMLGPPPDGTGETRGTRPYSPVGNRAVDEDYTIPCYIDVRQGGATQKQVRDDAEAVFNAFWALVKADPTFGGLFANGSPVEITDFASIPEIPGTGTAAEHARRQVLYFSVHCVNRVFT